MPEIIKAWVYDPRKALFGRKSDKAACLTVTCENHEGCDLYKKMGTCALLGSSYSCKSGKKTRETGPTQRARGFHDWIAKKSDWCADVSHELKPFKAHERIFYTNGWYCLPYPAMSDSFLVVSNAIRDSWVREEDMTAELLEKLCTTTPRNVFGDRIRVYQSEVIPKFIMDLKTHYPHLYALLPEGQQARAENFDYSGREALLSTVAPGPVTIAREIWQWDGKELSRENDTFIPVKGKIKSVVVPNANVTVKITDNAQVTADTEFVD